MIKTENTELKIITYPDGEQSIGNIDEILKDLDENPKLYWTPTKDYAKELIFLLAISLKYRPTIMNNLEWLKGRGKWITLYATYLPWGREDKTENGRLDMSSAMMSLLSNFNRVVVPSLHSTEWSNFISKENVCLAAFFPDTLVIFPDESAYEREKNVLMNSAIGGKSTWITLKKTRNKKTGEIIGQEIDWEKSNPHDADALRWLSNNDGFERLVIVDDICSKGGTFVGALNLVRPFVPYLLDESIALYTWYDEGQPDKKWKYEHHFVHSLDFH